MSYYRLKINEQKGINTYSQVLALKHKTPLYAEIDIYPNPSQYIVNINIPEGHNLSEVLFFNMSGKLVMTLKNAQNIDVSKLNSGVYIIQTITDKLEQKIKFIKH